MKTKTRLFIMLAILASITNFSFAQDVSKQSFDSLASENSKLKSEIDLLKKLKITGYIQAQYQHADTTGISSYAGGNFPANVQDRFAIRRGRIKATYDNGLSQFIFQADFTEKGVGVKDAYIKLTDPWTKTFVMQSGIFDRPFGFEISYSSSQRESPERSRLFQTIFPGERDLGAKISFQPPKTSPFNVFKIEGGLFNGTGPTASDFDSKKDFIGNISYNKSLTNEKASFGLRASYYNGGVRQATKFIYETGIVRPDTMGFMVDSASSNKGAFARRQYYGADAQATVEFPFGLSTLRGEYIMGVQPGTTASSASPTSDPNTDMYIRNFEGGYVYFLQNIGQTKNQLVLKYDWYDPNTDVKGDEIGISGTKLNKTDLKYSTIGIGWIYRWDANVKFTLYYDFVTNETSNNLTGYKSDLKDNVLTARIQYKF